MRLQLGHEAELALGADHGLFEEELTVGGSGVARRGHLRPQHRYRGQRKEIVQS
jgi:hypothetical protein